MSSLLDGTEDALAELQNTSDLGLPFALAVPSSRRPAQGPRCPTVPTVSRTHTRQPRGSVGRELLQVRLLTNAADAYAARRLQYQLCDASTPLQRAPILGDFDVYTRRALDSTLDPSL